jgi:integrase/recombinase XerD
LAAGDDLEAHAAAWLDALRARNYAAGSLAACELALRFFRAWAHERGLVRVDEITRPILESYQRALARTRRRARAGKDAAEPLAWSTQAVRLGALREWFRWLTRQNVLLHNPASELELPRAERRLPPAALTPEELARLFAVPDPADPLGLRDRTMLEVLYATGLRRSELCAVAGPDVNLERGTLTVRQGKGKKDRVVPLGARAVFWLRRYLGEARPRLVVNPREPALFLSGYGEAFNPDVFGRMVAAWVARAGLKGRGSCHLLRHTCATHMHEGGADIRHIQQLLGHASLETTAIYTDVTIRQLLEAHARCHPGARLPTDGQSPQSTP